ncbi:MAG: ABC transporter permease [Eubacteriaceae bacterium]
MLGKLLKHEIKATGRVFLPMYVALLVLTIVSKITLSLTIGNFNLEETVLPLAAQISLALFVTIIVALTVMTLIVVIQRFYKNLLTDEGYLMFTLPAKTWQLIISKLLVACLWFAICTITICLTIMILCYNREMMAEIGRGLPLINQEFFNYFGKNLGFVTFEFVISAIVQGIFSILVIYVSIALGQLFNEHRIMAAFGMYIALNIVVQIITLIIMFGFMPWLVSLDVNLATPGEIMGKTELFMNVTSFIFILLSVACYWITNFLLKRKLNLE